MAFDAAIPLPRFNLKEMMKKLPKEGEHTVNNCCPISMSKSPKQSICAEMKGLTCPGPVPVGRSPRQGVGLL